MSSADTPVQCGSSRAERVAERIARGLLSGLRAAVIDKRLDDYGLVAELLKALGVRQGILWEDLGSLVIIHVDMSLFETQCAYAHCANIENRVEKEMCAKRCAAEMSSKVAAEVSRRLCELARQLSDSEKSQGT